MSTLITYEKLLENSNSGIHRKLTCANVEDCHRGLYTNIDAHGRYTSYVKTSAIYSRYTWNWPKNLMERSYFFAIRGGLGRIALPQPAPFDHGYQFYNLIFSEILDGRSDNLRNGWVFRRETGEMITVVDNRFATSTFLKLDAPIEDIIFRMTFTFDMKLGLDVIVRPTDLTFGLETCAHMGNADVVKRFCHPRKFLPNTKGMTSLSGGSILKRMAGKHLSAATCVNTLVSPPITIRAMNGTFTLSDIGLYDCRKCWTKRGILDILARENPLEECLKIGNNYQLLTMCDRLVYPFGTKFLTPIEGTYKKTEFIFMFLTEECVCVCDSCLGKPTVKE